MKNLTFCLALLLAALPALAEEDAANGWRELKSIFENSTALPIQSVLPENTDIWLNGKCFYKDGTILSSIARPRWYIQSFKCVEPGEIFANNDNIKPYCRPSQFRIEYSPRDVYAQSIDSDSMYSVLRTFTILKFKFVEHKQNKYMITQEKNELVFVEEESDNLELQDFYCHYPIKLPPATAEVEQAQEEPEKVSWLEWVENLLGL